MVSFSGAAKRAAVINKKLHMVHSIKALRKASILLSAIKNIGDLQQKLDQAMSRDAAVAAATAETSVHQISMSAVIRVEGQEKEFIVSIYCERSCPGLLVYVLEAFEEMGLDVLQARVSCSDSQGFQLQAIACKEEIKERETEAREIEEAIKNAIHKWTTTS